MEHKCVWQIFLSTNVLLEKFAELGLCHLKHVMSLKNVNVFFLFNIVPGL